MPRAKETQTAKQKVAAALPPPLPLFRYEFREPLLEGVVQQRKGRFTLEVLVDGEVLLCHCPSTGLNPNKELLNSGKVPCLISKVDQTVKRFPDQLRQTQYTVEAISLDNAKTWIGINQVGVARYVGHFLQAGGMPEVCRDPTGLKAEQKVGKCRIDFVHQGRDTIELKMFPPSILRSAPGKAPKLSPAVNSPDASDSLKNSSKIRSLTERITHQLSCMIDHLQEQRVLRGLSKNGLVREQQLARRPGVDDPRAILLMCYQNIEPPVKIPKGALRSGAPVMAAFSAAKKAGVEFWQVNMQIDRTGVTLASYAPRNLLPGPLQRHIAKLSGYDYMQQALPALKKPQAKRAKRVSPPVHEVELVQRVTEMQSAEAVVDPPAAELPDQQHYLQHSWRSDTLSAGDVGSLLSDLQRLQVAEEATESHELMAA
ncbi:probable sugar fermentation stimulation protein homolog at N-terminal half [Coccomyxa sp. Obi]|nr:probable sugar fermentation stimulation protein homolog at N-terminal half [Coccomyxa sp. Obi]